MGISFKALDEHYKRSDDHRDSLRAYCDVLIFLFNLVNKVMQLRVLELVFKEHSLALQFWVLIDFFSGNDESIWKQKASAVLQENLDVVEKKLLLSWNYYSFLHDCIRLKAAVAPSVCGTWN